MFSTLRSRISKRYFDFSVSGILNTPPARCSQESNAIVLTQLYPPDITMYLLAVKSFARYFQPNRYVVVDDRLSESNRLLIGSHLEQVHFISTTNVRTEKCPSGGCWERLLSISNINETHYVVQLDADTLTIREPTEVIQCIEQNRSFSLGTYIGREVTSLQAASNYAQSHHSNHVQILGEVAFKDYPGKEKLKYARACAGFSGFARHSIRTEDVQVFSNTMADLVGSEKWAEWGSEQLTSNFFIANSKDPLILPVESYPFMSPKIDVAQSRLIHFYGPSRFSGGTYAQLSRDVIAELMHT